MKLKLGCIVSPAQKNILFMEMDKAYSIISIRYEHETSNKVWDQAGRFLLRAPDLDSLAYSLGFKK